MDPVQGNDETTNDDAAASSADEASRGLAPADSTTPAQASAMPTASSSAAWPSVGERLAFDQTGTGVAPVVLPQRDASFEIGIKPVSPMSESVDTSAPDEAWAPHGDHAPDAAVELRPADALPATEILTAPALSTYERLLAGLFSRRALTLGSTARDRLWGWLGPSLMALLAAALRLFNINSPHSLVFDETYYVKDAYTLLRLGYDAQWPDQPDDRFVSGLTDIYNLQASYTVHPPIGKWLIAMGLNFGGVDNPWAWRIATVLAGILAVFILARTARRLFGSTAIGIIAGGLLAIDGIAIVLSRTALLDNFVMLFALIAFACLVVDREQFRRRLARQAADLIDAGKPLRTLTPHVGFRWWRLAAGLSLGLACGTKWSGLYFLAAFGVMTVWWDISARRAIGGQRWGLTWFFNDALPAFMAIVPTAVVVYLASWWSWFAHPQSWGRNWAGNNPMTYPDWLPHWVTSTWDVWRSFVEYHSQMYSFHTHLTSHHDYMSNPWGWLLQLRPTSFYWTETTDGSGSCGSNDCVNAILAIGNPILWWSAALALVVVLWALLRHRDWRAGAIIAGMVGGWVPWLFFAKRTIFTFYTVAFVPFMVLAVCYVIALRLERSDQLSTSVVSHPTLQPLRTIHRARRQRRNARVQVGVYLGVVVLASAFFYPLWAGLSIPRWFWEIHMWLGSMWI